MSDKGESYFKHTQHLVRMAGIFAVGVVLFLIFRAVLVPDGFGMYGHYRPAAVTDNMNHAVKFAGRTACAECHEEVLEYMAGGKHENVGCESCHGAHGAHASDPAAVAAVRPEVPALCSRCHETNVARPDWFPQVKLEEHSEGASCNDCHEPHFPL